jgi:hypothetical protein
MPELSSEKTAGQAVPARKLLRINIPFSRTIEMHGKKRAKKTEKDPTPPTLSLHQIENK